ncbi:MAG: biopolymer transporter ExbD [Pseudobdellovibrio sp.]
MAHIESSGKGRTTNVDLNLVPFIDLMSVLITFLLISAVWTQVSMIQLGASFAAPKKQNETEYKPPLLEDLVLRLDVVANGYVLKFGSQTKPIPKLSSEYDTDTLVTELQKIKKLYPDKPGIKISISDDIVYEHVISAMDAGLKAGFAPELLTGGPN